MKYALIILCLFMLVSCSRDAQRQNPLDPRLTSPVELSIAMDDTAGTVTLDWSQYEGEAVFAHYLVLRNVVQSTVVETLATVAEAGQTVFVDSSVAAETAHEYRISVINASGLQVDSERVTVRPLSLPPVHIATPAFESTTASATLVWTRYRGPDFSFYEVRRAADQDIHTVANVQALADTSIIDTGLRGNTPYTYEVLVHTTDGQIVASPPAVGGFHLLAGVWDSHDLPIFQNAGIQSVRLYGRASGVESLIRTPTGPRSMTLNADGAATVAWKFEAFGDPDARSLSVALLPSSESLLSLHSWAGQQQALLLLNSEGKAQHDVFEMSLPAVPEEIGPSAQVVDGEVRIITHFSNSAPFSHFTDLAVLEGSTTVFEEAFDFAPTSVVRETDPLLLGGWILSDGFNGSFEYARWPGGGISLARTGQASRRDSSWSDLALTATIATGGWASVQIGGDTLSSVTLTLSASPDPTTGLGSFDGWARLRWSYRAPGDESSTIADSTWEALTSLPQVGHDVHLSFADGVPRATIRSPRLHHMRTDTEQTNWASLASINEQTIAYTAGNVALALDAQGQSQELGNFSSNVSETRVWQLPEASLPSVAVCLPQDNVVLAGEAFNASRWFSAVRSGKELGPRLGQAGGTLFYPVSMDVGPHGRIYILDAGNARVVVLNAEGGYITEFGAAGNGAGEFNFGTGEPIEAGLNFAGSLAVDNDGFIYVADVGNQRIQKFAP